MSFDIYAAGLFDGEGCVEAYLHKQSRGRGKMLVTNLSVSNTDLRLLVAMYDNFGGSLRLKKQYSQHPKWNQAGEWQVHGKLAEEFARRILPYTISKHAQLEAFLELRATVQTQLIRVKTSPEIQALRAHLVSQIKNAKLPS